PCSQCGVWHHGGDCTEYCAAAWRGMENDPHHQWGLDPMACFSVWTIEIPRTYGCAERKQAEVGFGSKCERLTKSICFPVYPNNQTVPNTIALSGWGRFPTSKALSGAREIGGVWCTDSAVRILSRRMHLSKLGKQRRVSKLLSPARF